MTERERRDSGMFVRGFVVARFRDGGTEVVGSICKTREEAERKRAIADERLGAGPAWTVQAAVLALVEMTP
jgi:hypothetical protein